MIDGKGMTYVSMAKKMGFERPEEIKMFCEAMMLGKKTASEIVRNIFQARSIGGKNEK